MAATEVLRDGWRRLSWELAERLLDSQLPALAALGAILTVQGTVKGTVSFGVQQVVGVTVGVAAARRHPGSRHRPHAGRRLVSIFVDAGRLLHEIDPDSGAHTGAVPPAPAQPG